jgi:AraC-like DNA-binding protein
VFLIHLIDILRFYFFSWDIKLEAAYFLINNIWNGLNAVHASKILTIEANFIIAILQLGVYIILIWVLIISKNLHFYIGKVNPQQFRLIKNWLFFFAFIFSYLALIQVVIGLFFIKYKDKMILIEKYKFLFTMLVLGLIILEIGLLLFPKVLYGVPLYKRANLGSQPLIADEVQSEKSFKNTNAILSDEHLKWIVLSLEDWTNSKKYLESDVTMITLSADVNIPIHHLAYYFNQLSEYKFIEWRNNLRIDYVVELIKNKQCQNKTVDTLGKECGFKSNSTFVQNFKLRTGMLPSDLMKKYQ